MTDVRTNGTDSCGVARSH